MNATVRLIAISWWLQLKTRTRDPFDGLLSIVFPLFFATTVVVMFGQNGSE